jgi:hypothetical protein
MNRLGGKQLFASLTPAAQYQTKRKHNGWHREAEHPQDNSLVGGQPVEPRNEGGQPFRSREERQAGEQDCAEGREDAKFGLQVNLYVQCRGRYRSAAGIEQLEHPYLGGHAPQMRDDSRPHPKAVSGDRQLLAELRHRH